MTLYETIDWLKKIALKHPNIGSASEGNIYEYMNANPSVKYGVFFITQGTHSQDEMFNHFEFTLFYVDRLVDDMEENRLQIQSIGKEILSNILTFFCEEFDAECENISFQPFTQRFVDETAGIYSTITIDVPKDVICPEEYWKEDWVAPVTVIRNQDKRVVFTENGTYTIDYDPTTYTGLGNVEVNVNIDVDSYYNNGYNQGKTDGVNEQKSKLETINITQNGTYTKEDGYNHIEVNVPDLNGSYDEGHQDGYNQGHTEGVEEGYNNGYKQGQADISANARVLNVTKNGNYLSKYSDPIVPEVVTGVYADNTEFYNYALISNIIYSTGIIPNQNTRLEFWFKPYGTEYENWEIIIGSQRGDDTTDTFQVRRYSSSTNFVAEIGTSEVSFTMSENEWHHIIMSVADGFVLDGTKIGDFTENMTESNTPLQIGGSINFNGQRTEEGYYGMIKITTNGVENIIIPTENGFKNVTTDQILQTLKDGSYTFTENLPIYGEGELYKTINVNVIPKINLQKTGLKLGFSSFTEVPEWADFEGITDMNHMFYNCGNLQSIPEINTSNVKDMSYMLTECRKLTTVPTFDTSNVINFQYCFHNSKIIELPQFDLRKGTNFYEFCYNCYDLKYVPNLDLSSATNISGLLENCNSLISVGELKVPNVRGRVTYFLGGSNKNNLTDFGGLIGFRGSITSDGFHTCPNLSYQSCINILNGLYDFSGNGETPNSDEGKLKVAQSFIDKVGDEISIATNKGWVISV